MPLIGVRELRERTAEVLRQVREEKAEYIITHQGHPMALLLPLNAKAAEAALLEAGKQATGDKWETYIRITEQIRQGWPADKHAQEVLDEVRR